MLGRLLSSAISAPATAYSSISNQETEDNHTRLLLYPDTTPLSPTFYNEFRNDVDDTKDIRVIVAQDGTGSEQKLAIFDSKPVRAITTNDDDRVRYTPAPQQTNAFARRRAAVPNVFGSPQTLSGAAEDEMRILTECMFGSSVLAYKGSSTKIHMLPSAPKSQNRVPAASRRHSLISPTHATFDSAPRKERETKSVLVTRTFSVIVPTAQASNNSAHVSFNIPPRGAPTFTPDSSVGSTNGFPFPNMKNTIIPTSAMKLPRPPKTINYAVALVISVPSTTQHIPNLWTPPPKTTDSRDYFLKSAQSEESTDTIDDRMDVVTKHWDVITRALSEIQGMLSIRITEALRRKVSASPPLMYSHGVQQKTTLYAGALMEDAIIKSEVERLRWRIISGMSIPRAVTGQGRWGSWREEAKWAGILFGGRDKNFFFLTLLTAFLGHHTDWLDVLGPKPYRKRHIQQQRALNNGDLNIPFRTVVICHDKIAARKLIYLLSAFLPARNPPTQHQNHDAQGSAFVKGSSDDGNLSVSPKKQGIRRVPSKLSMVEAADEADPTKTWDIPKSARSVQFFSESPHGSSSSKHLPIPFATGVKSNSTTTTANATPHAANLSSSLKSNSENRPGSSCSTASINLQHTLRRHGTNNSRSNESVNSHAGWGSFLSNISIWSNPRSRGSISGASSASTLADNDMGTIDARLRRHYSDEDCAGLYLGMYDELADDAKNMAFSPSRGAHENFVGHNFEESTLRYTVDEEEGVVDVDLGLSSGFTMDGTGYSPMPSSPTSTNHADSSMENSTISLSALTLLRPFPAATGESDSTGNVAGELERFHPDFVLQAVKPYANIQGDIRRAMSAEAYPAWVPSPSGLENIDNKWTDVSTTLIADTRTNKITRVKLRRRKCAAASPGDISTVYGIQQISDEEEEFTEELVMDMDETLVTAVEGVIAGAPAQSSLSRRSSVTSQLSRTKSRGATDRKMSTDFVVPPQECRNMVLGALEDVVRQVASDPRGYVENVLTEGVARWLSEVQDGTMV